MVRWLILLIAIQPGLVIAQDVQKLEFFIKDPLVVTNQQHLRDIDFRVVSLDAFAKVTQRVNRQLSSSEDQASDQALMILNDPAIQTELTEAFKADLRAYRLGIDRVPAVIVNDTFIIYGTTDVAEVLAISQSELVSQGN